VQIAGGRMVRRLALLATLAVTLSARAEDLAPAQAFARNLYTAYRTGDPDYLGRKADRTFTPRLLGLIRRDQATTPSGDVGILDGDPICDCQDPAGLRLTHLAIRAAGQGRAQALVTLRLAGEVRPLKLDLVATRAGWRVADINTRDTPSLAGLLQTGLDQRTRRAR